MRVLTLFMLLGLSSGFLAPQKSIIDLGKLSHHQKDSVRLDMISSLTDFFFPPKSESPSKDDSKKEKLLNLLAQVEPSKSTSKELTNDILNAVVELEKECPTLNEDVLPSIAGNWELIWTAQDKANMPTTNREQANFFGNWINPLENQSYSNNPSGRANPILPQNIQNNLEDVGILSERDVENSVKSTQAIDLKKKRIRNVVAFEVNNPTPLFSKNGKTQGFITVDVKGSANDDDLRRIDVKFDQFRVAITDSPIDITLPLGVIGPTGWLRTGYVDEDVRITRGHKGSVFILSKTSAKSKR